MEERLKILMTADSIGGVWTYAVDLCQSLPEHDFHLAVMGRKLSAQQRKQVELPNVTVYESDYRLEWMENPWDDLEQARQWLFEIREKVNPTLIHFNNYGQTEFKWNCPTVTVFHSCVLTWWRSVKHEDAPSNWDRYAKCVSDALSESDVVVFPTDAMRIEAEAIYGRQHNGIVIHNGRNLPKPIDIPKEPFIFCAGRLWDEAKNISMLADVAESLPWPVFIAGDNGRSLNIPGNVTFLGELSQDEMREWLLKASIYVNCAKYEPFGLAVLEAANCGCALALSRLDTLWEVWENNALYFNPNRAEDLRQTLVKLINDAALRRKMSKFARQQSELYSVTAAAMVYNALYRKHSTDKIQYMI